MLWSIITTTTSMYIYVYTYVVYMLMELWGCNSIGGCVGVSLAQFSLLFPNDFQWFYILICIYVHTKNIVCLCVYVDFSLATHCNLLKYLLNYLPYVASIVVDFVVVIVNICFCLCLFVLFFFLAHYFILRTYIT